MSTTQSTTSFSGPVHGGDDRPSRYVETRDDETVVVYRASALGTCTRAYVAMAHGIPGAPTPEWMQEVFDEGHVAEPLIRDAYAREYGVEVTDDQREVELDLGHIEQQRVIIRGHIDGITSDGKLFEAKKFRESTWPKFVQQGIECNVNYPWQVSVYMHALDLDEAAFVGGKVTSASEISDLSLHEIGVKVIAQPPFSLAAIRKRVVAIEKVIAQGFVPSEVECNKATYPCPFYKLHDPDDEPFQFDGEARDVADTLFASYAQVAAECKAAEDVAKVAGERKKRVAEALRDLLDNASAESASAGKIIGTDYELTRVRKTIPAHERKASTQDYFTIRDKTSPKTKTGQSK